MKENIGFPWRKIIFSSVLSVFVIFVLGFVDAVLCYYYVIALRTAEIMMLPVAFFGNFIGCMCVSYEGKSILCSILSSCFTFVLMNGAGLFTDYRFNTEYTLAIFIILCVSAIICCIIKALIR